MENQVVHVDAYGFDAWQIFEGLYDDWERVPGFWKLVEMLLFVETVCSRANEYMLVC